jgi:ParB family chromosome partitioning protein
MEQAMSVLTSIKTEEWFTPPEYIAMVRAALGGQIDLDPASCARAQKWINAKRIFTEKDDGLVQEWKANKLFLNPPYCGKTAVWADKLISELTIGNTKSAVLLVNSSPGYKWYEALWKRYVVCCVEERIRFIQENGEVGGQAKKASTFVYFGDNPFRFAGAFRSIGRIIFPK